MPWRPGEQKGQPDAGALTLSYVIIFPAFLFALLVIVQASMWYLARDIALAAARQGADAARAYGAPADAGPGAALTFVSSHGSGLLTRATATSAGSTAATVQIAVTGNAPALIPGLPIRVTETVQEPMEQFTP
jgi:TadE-like protein